jgi:tetratricopeptide (TPR) repeat protein
MTGQDSLPNRILLGQLISNGDCLYATAVARQIKHDFPGCHLTWAVSSLCRRIIEENPFVDEIWEIPLANWAYELLPGNWSSFVDEALERYERGVYDFIFFTQIYPGNPHHFEGTVRPGIFLGYPGKITVPLQPSLVLRTEEVERVNDFAQRHRLHDFDQVILFECSSKSGQTHITPEFALQAAEKIASKSSGKHAVILSSHHAVARLGEGIIDGSVLTLREMAELTKYCTLLIGCSSGISTVSTSTWAKSLPMIQMLTNRCAMFASLAHDYLYFGLPTSHVIEMFDADVERLVSCFDSFLQKGWAETRGMYHEEPQVTFGYYLDFVRDFVVKAYDYYGFCVSLRHTVDRYGWRPELETALKQFAKNVLPQSGASPDELLSQLERPARALSLASIGMLGYNPASIRPNTCVLSLCRNKRELGRLFQAMGGLLKDDPEISQLVVTLIDPAPKEKVAILQRKGPEKQWSRVAWALALMQEAEYAEAQQELSCLKQSLQFWSPQLEEVLADLNWMQGNHAEALSGYQEAQRNRPNHRPLQEKIDRLVTRKDGRSAIAKPEVELRDVGLVFYPTQTVDSSKIKTLVKSQLEAAGAFNLETAYVAKRVNHVAPWSLVGPEELQKANYELLSNRPKTFPNCKKFVDASARWARRKGKKWIALTALDSIITASLLRELEGQLAQAPTALIVNRWDIPETARRAAGLILIRVNWWEENRRRFVGYNLRKTDWIARYAKKISKFSKAAYLIDPEQWILTTQVLSFLAAAFMQPNGPRPKHRQDFGASVRSKLFEFRRLVTRALKPDK